MIRLFPALSSVGGKSLAVASSKTPALPLGHHRFPTHALRHPQDPSLAVGHRLGWRHGVCQLLSAPCARCSGAASADATDAGGAGALLQCRAGGRSAGPGHRWLDDESRRWAAWADRRDDPHAAGVDADGHLGRSDGADLCLYPPDALSPSGAGGGRRCLARRRRCADGNSRLGDGQPGARRRDRCGCPVGCVGLSRRA